MSSHSRHMCAWCWQSVSARDIRDVIRTPDGAGGTLTFCNDHCRISYKDHVQLPGHPPISPVGGFKPSWGEFGECPACDWCWNPARKAGFLGWKGGVKMPPIEPAGEPLWFCDETCAVFFHELNMSRSARLECGIDHG